MSRHEKSAADESGWPVWIAILGVVVALVLVVVGVTVWLLFAGDKASHVSGALQFFIAAVVLLTSAVGTLRKTGVRTSDQLRAEFDKMSRKKVAVTLLIILALGLGAGVGYGYRAWMHKPDIPATDLVAVAGGQGIRDGGEATIRFPTMPLGRRYVSIIPSLSNPQAVGDCVGPATLDVELVKDGHRQGVESYWRSGDEIRLDLAGTARTALVEITVHMQDDWCAVDLSVAQATLYDEPIWKILR